MNRPANSNRLVTSLLASASALILLSCATTTPPGPAIEPTTIEPSPGGAPSGGPGNASGGGESNKFVVSRDPINEARPSEDSLHIGEKWWKFRSSFLKVSESAARERDMSISTKQAPQGFWDGQTRLETVQIWSGLCNQCHGGRRYQADAVSMPPPPPTWGQGEGLFFGIRRQYADVFNTVTYGGPKHEGKVAMPSWKTVLAKEEIWALLYFLEYQSGGIEGRFPPSLYPRLQTDVGQQ
jgi:mono/diheme cytochrome c family protein